MLNPMPFRLSRPFFGLPRSWRRPFPVFAANTWGLVLGLALILMLGLVPPAARAITYSNFIENGGWSSESSKFACSLIHTIPYLGKAEFAKPAGEPMVFNLKVNNPSLKTGQAQLVAAPPVWKNSSGRSSLGFVPVQERKLHAQAQGLKPERMLAELFDGQELILSRKPRYGGDETTKVAITPIGFRAAYRLYTACLADLLPVNFEQIQRTSIYFGSDQHELTPSEQNKLDNIVTYLKADPIVQEFFIDGHTDAVGSQPDNLALAKKRAETVSRYLIKNGMSKDAFWVRWHGERYPVASNKDRLGRAKNRRVTIRLETEKTQAEETGDSTAGGDTRPAEPGAPEPTAPQAGTPPPLAEQPGALPGATQPGAAAATAAPVPAGQNATAAQSASTGEAGAPVKAAAPANASPGAAAPGQPTPAANPAATPSGPPPGPSAQAQPSPAPGGPAPAAKL